MLKLILLLFTFIFVTTQENTESIHNQEIALLERVLMVCESEKESLGCLLAKTDYYIARIKRLCDLSWKYEDNCDTCIYSTDKFFETMKQYSSIYIDNSIKILKEAARVLIRPQHGIVKISKIRIDKQLCKLYLKKGEEHSKDINHYCCAAHDLACEYRPRDN